MDEIILSKGRAVALVDDSDFGWLGQWSWHLGVDGCAVRIGRKSEGSLWRKSIYMHRQILGVADSFVVDHINHNRLDNRRCNLRVCSVAQNAQNQRLCKDSSSGYKGVSFHKGLLFWKKPWQASICLNGKKTALGCFSSREKAAVAYNEAAQSLHGEFAYLNLVKDKFVE